MMNDCARTAYDALAAAAERSTSRRRFVVMLGNRTVWCVEMVWAVGLWAVLLLTRRKFRFSTPAYLCFFVWAIFCDTLGAICSSGLYLCRERKSAK